MKTTEAPTKRDRHGHEDDRPGDVAPGNAVRQLGDQETKRRTHSGYGRSATNTLLRNRRPEFRIAEQLLIVRKTDKTHRPHRGQ